MNAAIDKIKHIIDLNQLPGNEFSNFVLQGGAGSGKTESLKEIIQYISDRYPDKKIACITHTNVAVDEIKSRIGNKYEISTIHTFLNSLTKNYKKNIKEIIYHIFCLPEIVLGNHDEYKKAYASYSKKIFSIKHESIGKVVGKRDYDKCASEYNLELLSKIGILNQEIKEIILSKDYSSVGYNESRFDSFEDLTYSHDSLLTVCFKLCEHFDILPKIISDKYDFIIIDEFQDTNKNIIQLFLKLLPHNKKTTIGLFGDSMQGIYEDGIGDVEVFINQGLLTKVEKDDNFRCSKEVIDFINILRNDGIKQKVALKKHEEEGRRKGKVILYYSIYGKKPSVSSAVEDKLRYSKSLNELIALTKSDLSKSNTKILMLTNKSISTEVDFSNLYKVFNDRFMDVKEEIEKELSKIQISEVAELCRLFDGKQYNALMVYLKKHGFQLNTVDDKKRITEYFEHLLNDDLTLDQALLFALGKKLIRKSERHKNYLLARESFLSELEFDTRFKLLELHYLKGSNTKVRLKTEQNIDLSDEEFNDFERILKKKRFAVDLFSDKVSFREVLNYYKYINEETGYITMHKTKGSGIENVIVVLDEYLWSQYNFKSIYDPSKPEDIRIKNQKLFYVACSRTIYNLGIVLLIEDNEEEKLMKDYFSFCEIIEK